MSRVAGSTRTTLQHQIRPGRYQYRSPPVPRCDPHPRLWSFRRRCRRSSPVRASLSVQRHRSRCAAIVASRLSPAFHCHEAASFTRKIARRPPARSRAAEEQVRRGRTDIQPTLERIDAEQVRSDNNFGRSPTGHIQANLLATCSRLSVERESRRHRRTGGTLGNEN